MESIHLHLSFLFIIIECKRIVIYKIFIIRDYQTIVGIHSQKIIVVFKTVDKILHYTHIVIYINRTGYRRELRRTEHLIKYIYYTVVCYQTLIDIGLDNFHIIVGIVCNSIEFTWHCSRKRFLHKIVDECCNTYLRNAVKSFQQSIHSKLVTIISCKLNFRGISFNQEVTGTMIFRCLVRLLFCEIFIQSLIIWNEHCINIIFTFRDTRVIVQHLAINIRSSNAGTIEKRTAIK